MNNLFLLMLLVVPIGLVFFWIKKKKKGDSSANTIKKRREGDEVWKTIKDYIKSNNEAGKEIVESYVAKRPNVNIVDKKLPKEQRKEIEKQLKEKKQKEKEEQKQIKKSGKKLKQKKEKELYVVLFVTRNAKTLVEDSPRAIECEVTNTKISRKETKRQIIVTRECSYEKEAEWILPIKEAEEAKLRKEQAKKKPKKASNKNKKSSSNKAPKEDKWKKKEQVVSKK